MQDFDRRMLKYTYTRCCELFTAQFFRTTHTHIVSLVLVCASVHSCLWQTVPQIGPHKNERHTKKSNYRFDTGCKSDSWIVRIVRFVGTAVGRYYLVRCIFRVDRSYFLVSSRRDYWTYVVFWEIASFRDDH